MLFNNSKIKSLQSQIERLQREQMLSSVSRLTQIYPSWQTFKELEAFEKFDDIYSIVSYLSETAAMIPLYGYKVVNENSLKNYKRSSGLLKKTMQTKALEDLNEKNTTAQLLKSLTMDRKVAIYLSLFLNGETLLIKNKVDIGPRTGQIDLIQVSPVFMTAIITDSYPEILVGWKYSKDGYEFTLTATEVIQIKMPNPNPRSWRGLSPIVPLAKRLTRIESGMNVSTAQMQNGGLPGVIYEKDLGTNMLGKRREDFAKFVSNNGNTGVPYWMDGDIGYVQVGTILADLQLSELSNIDFKKLCNAYRFPAQLLNNDEGAKYDNMDSAEKRLYTNAILPNVMRVRDALNEGLFLADRGEYIDFDISEINALQDDLKAQAEALNMMWWITPNEKRAVTKYDNSDNPLMDEIIIDSGKQLLNELEPITDNELTRDYRREDLQNGGEDD